MEENLYSNPSLHQSFSLVLLYAAVMESRNLNPA